MVRLSLLFIALAAAPMAVVPAQTPPAATKADVWTPARTQEILSRTETIRLAPNISHLSSAERTAVQKLIEVGGIFQRIYEDQRHHQALAAKARLREGSPDAALYRLRVPAGPAGPDPAQREFSFNVMDRPAVQRWLTARADSLARRYLAPAAP